MITDKRCKGIKKCVVRKTLCFNDYKSTLEEGKIIYRDQMLIQHKNHDVFTNTQNKVALDRDDDKRITPR